jgi:hypothetical protein
LLEHYLENVTRQGLRHCLYRPVNAGFRFFVVKQERFGLVGFVAHRVFIFSVKEREYVDTEGNPA